MSTQKKHILMVLSGGMDSVTMLHEYASEIELAVNFSYGSNHNMKSTVVPFRNGIMLAAAAGLAESRGLDAVMIANHAGDHALYPDCRGSFIDAMSRAISEGTYDGITVKAPYTYLSKGDIAARGARLGIDYSTTYSCYKGREQHCGRCGTCLERRKALADAGITDTTVYEEP